MGPNPIIPIASAPIRPNCLGTKGKAPIQIFSMLDTDGDDKLLKSEVPKQLLPTFEKLDKNGDGILERAEVPK